MKITALAGGVGGAKLVNGLSKILAAEDLTVIVNTADDFWFHGLYISPDIDTVIYNLSGCNHPEQGWGRNEDTYHFLDEMSLLGEEEWFHIGDKDLATHILRTDYIDQKKTLTEITDLLRKKRNIQVKVLPMCDQPVATIVDTIEYGELPFQEYFVKYHFKPRTKSIRFAGIEEACISTEVTTTIEESDLIVICPSNPLVSIGPILAIQGMLDLLLKKKVIAISPLIGGKTIKGPAAKMFEELGVSPSSLAVARYYNNILDGFVIDSQDQAEKMEIERCGIILMITDTLMLNVTEQTRLAHEVIEFGKEVIQAKSV